MASNNLRDFQKTSQITKLHYMKIPKIKHLVRKLEKNCPTCSSVYTLLETHLTDKEIINCPSNCEKT